MFITLKNCSGLTAPQILEKRKEILKWQVELAGKLIEKKKDQAKVFGMSPERYYQFRKRCG